MDALGGSVVKNAPANAGDTGDVSSIPGLGRSPGGGNDNPLQCFCLKKSYGQRIGHSPWGLKNWGTEHTHKSLIAETEAERPLAKVAC